MSHQYREELKKGGYPKKFEMAHVPGKSSRQKKKN